MSISRLGLVLLTACTSSTLAPPVSAIEPAPSELRDERFVAEIANAAASYKPWGRIDERPNIAPGLCRMPRREDYGMASHVRQSKEGPHGTKLYYLWASNRAYGILPKVPLEDGFTIVKESFAATPVAPASAGTERIQLEGVPSPIRWLETDHGKLFAGAPMGLYVMKKLGTTEGTDEGWIYGTVAPTGEVTSAGRVESCMGCHEAATHGRLFGLQPTKQLVDVAPPGAPS